MMGCGALGGVNIIDTESGAEKQQLRHQTADYAGGVDAVAWAPCSRRLAAGMMYGDSHQPTVVVWDVRHAAPELFFPIGSGQKSASGLGESTTSLAWSPDVSQLAVGLEGGTLQLFASNSGQRLREIRAAQGEYCVYAFSPDWRLVAGGCQPRFDAPGVKPKP